MALSIRKQRKVISSGFLLFPSSFLLNYIIDLFILNNWEKRSVLQRARGQLVHKHRVCNTSSTPLPGALGRLQPAHFCCSEAAAKKKATQMELVCWIRLHWPIPHSHHVRKIAPVLRKAWQTHTHARKEKDPLSFWRDSTFRIAWHSYSLMFPQSCKTQIHWQDTRRTTQKSH